MATSTIYIMDSSGVIYSTAYDDTTGDYDLGEQIPNNPFTDNIALAANHVTVTKDDYSSDNTTTSIAEVYNQLQVECEVKEVEELITSPLDEDSMYSYSQNKTHYCTEYVSWGEGESAYYAWRDMISSGSTSYDGAEVVDHYAQVLYSTNWTFSGDQYQATDGKNQTDIFLRMVETPCVACLVKFGHVSGLPDSKDNSIDGTIDMTPYLVISINGNQKDTEGYNHPNDSELQAAAEAAPIAKYKGSLSGGYLSPTDDSTTNYIVIEGSMYLQSTKQRPSGYHDKITNDTIDWPWLKNNYTYSLLYGKTVDLKSSINAYYATKFYDNETPFSADVERTAETDSIFPYNSSWDGLTALPYNYSANWDQTDKLTKLPLLQCTLKIGDKYCCETMTESGVSTFQWLALEDCPTATYNGVTYTLNHIYLGVNPAIGDNFIGVKWDIANTVTREMNLDKEGMAIPVKMSDKLNGKVEFQIDGPVNSVYTEITRHHPSFWRHTSWSSESKFVLANIQSIWIESLEINIYSDNGQVSTDNQKSDDLIYKTEIGDPEYVNLKDDITFDISTALTTAEAIEHGLNQSIKLNNPCLLDGTPLYNIINVKNTDGSAKAEQLYLSNYWTEYQAPKTLVETQLADDDRFDWLSHFTFNTMSEKEFYVQSTGYNVKYCRKNFTLKEK